MTEESKEAIAGDAKLALVKLALDTLGMVSVRFGIWVVVAALGCGSAYFFYLDSRKSQDALIKELIDGRGKVSEVIQENSASNRQLASSIDKLSEEVRKK